MGWANVEVKPDGVLEVKPGVKMPLPDSLGPMRASTVRPPRNVTDTSGRLTLDRVPGAMHPEWVLMH